MTATCCRMPWHFYAELRDRFGLDKDEYLKLNDILGKEKPQGGFDKADLGQHPGCPPRLRGRQ